MPVPSRVMLTSLKVARLLARMVALFVTVKAELPPYAAPHELVLVEAIPRTAIGKVRRAALR